MANNIAFYDAVVAGAGGSIQGWAVDQLSADYATFANAVAAIATTVDLQIPIIPGGPNESQVKLLMSIAQNVLAGRFPVDATLALYTNLGLSIAAIYTAVSPKLQGASGTTGAKTLKYYVDPLNASLIAGVRNGTSDSPYITVMEALTAAVTAGLTKVQIILSGTDNSAITIPATLTNVCIKGYTNVINVNNFYDSLAGSINVNTPAGGTQLQLECLRISSPITVANGNPLLLNNCRLVSNITGDTGIIAIFDSEIAANITYAGALTLYWDDESYTYARTSGAVLSGAPLTNQHLGIGPRRYASNVTINGVAIGATAQGSTALAAAVAGNHGIITPTAPVAADYAVQFKYCDAGNVYWTLTNISRASTNFAEAVEILLLNGGI